MTDRRLATAILTVTVLWLASLAGAYAAGRQTEAALTERAVATAEGYRTELVGLLARCEAAGEAKLLIEWAGP